MQEFAYSSENLKKIRNGLSLSQAAAKAGVPQSSWSDYESGKKLPGYETLRRIAKGFGVKFVIG